MLSDADYDRENLPNCKRTITRVIFIEVTDPQHGVFTCHWTGPPDNQMVSQAKTPKQTRQGCCGPVPDLPMDPGSLEAFADEERGYVADDRVETSEQNT